MFTRRSILKYWMSLLFIIITFNHSVVAQNDGVGLKGSTSLFGQTGGPEVIGVHINHNVSHRVSLNVGVGLLLDAHIGTNVYLTNRVEKRKSLYLGAQLSNIREVNIIGSSRERQFGVYIPIGFEYIAPKGFTLQIDVGPNFVNDDYDQVNTLAFFGSIKVGYTFRKK